MKQYSLASYPLQPAGQMAHPLNGITMGNQSLNDFYKEGQSEAKLADTDLKPVTKTIQKFHKQKRRYVNTPNKVRSELIEAVNKHGEKIKDAAKRLGINYSSAKAMCQVYKKEGRSDKITVKKRKPKPDTRALKQDISNLIMRNQNEFTGKFVTKQENSFIKLEKFEENTYSSPESYEIACKEEAYATSDKESENFLKRFSSPSSLCQVNQNNIFVTFQPNPQKLNMISPKEFLPTHFQPPYGQAPNMVHHFGLQNGNAQQEFLTQMTNSTMPQANLGLPQIANFHPQYLSMDLASQLMLPSQSQIIQNPIYSPSTNFIMDPNTLMAHQLSAYSASQQSLNVQMAPMLNGYMCGTQYDQRIYYPKS